MTQHTTHTLARAIAHRIVTVHRRRDGRHCVNICGECVAEYATETGADNRAMRIMANAEPLISEAIIRALRLQEPTP